MGPSPWLFPPPQTCYPHTCRGLSSPRKLARESSSEAEAVSRRQCTALCCVLCASVLLAKVPHGGARVPGVGTRSTDGTS